MNSKTKITTRVITGLAALLITAGAVMKLIALPELVAIFSRIGLLPYLSILGLTELFFLALFLAPRTMRPGFLLLTAYYGGAMAVEFSHGQFFLFPMLILCLIWIAAYLRQPGIFLNQKPNQQTAQA